MNKCENCKHWDTDIWSEETTARICLAIKEEGSHKSASVVSGDYADSDGCLITQPDFGCVLWEKK